MATLGFIAQIPSGEVVFDYSEPLEAYPPDRRGGAEALIARTAAAGEPMIFFPPSEGLIQDLRSLGFEEIEDLDLGEISSRFLGGPKGRGRRAGPHFLRARRRG